MTQTSRRTLVKGAAWSIPVVAVAGAAPAYAASVPVVCIPEQEICGSFGGSACKHSGNPKYYHFTFCFTNTGDNPATVEFTEMVINGATAPRTPPPAPARDIRPGSVIVPADGLEHCYYVDGGPFDDSANGTGSLEFKVNGVSADIPINVTGLSPCGTGADDCPNPKTDPPVGGHPTQPAGPCY